MPPPTPLAVRSNYSLLRGAAPVEALLERAREMGYRALALTDRNNLYAAVRFYKRAREIGLKPILGCEVVRDGPRAVLLARDLAGYSNICRILTRRNLDPAFDLAEALARFDEGLHILTDDAELLAALAGRVERLWALLTPDAPERLVKTAEAKGVALAASPDVYLLDLADHDLHRVLAAIRLNALVSRVKPEALAPRRSFLPSPESFALLFESHPEALENNRRIVEDCNLELPMGRPIFPKFPLPDGATPAAYLKKLCLQGMPRRYRPVPAAAWDRLRHELEIIERLGFTEYFIFVWDILAYARERGIATIGRGSGASSIVSYLLGLTSVDPLKYDIPFERFLHLERADCPDLDIDLCWIRRDELIDSIYEKYGATRVAMVCTHSAFKLRGAFRDVAKAFGVSNDLVNRISRRLPSHASGGLRGALADASGDAHRAVDADILEQVIRFTDRVVGFPRHLSIHCGGLVIGDRPLDTYVPLEQAAKGIVVTQYEKDAVEDIGLVKMDFLGNHGLTIRDEALGLIAARRGEAPDIDAVPEGDPATIRALRSGRTISCVQLESPAMRHLLQMLRVGHSRDVMQALALVRPGPASLGTKETFVRRRRGLEPVTYPHPLLEPVLADSYGIMLYEDDGMLVATALAGVSMAEGDTLRKAIKKSRSRERLAEVSEGFIRKAAANGVPEAAAREMWEQMAKFTSYSFCKAHAASYGLLSYQLAWLKTHHPLEFMVAVLNHHWGMYPRRVHVEEARRLGVEVLPPDVNRSARAFTAEDGRIRVGLEQIKGLTQAAIGSILEQREARPFGSLADFMARVRLARRELESLIWCGAFDFTGRERPRMIWEAKTCHAAARRHVGQAFLFSNVAPVAEPDLGDYSPGRKYRDELRCLELSVSHHPMDFLRPRLEAEGYITARDLRTHIGRRVRIAGVLDADRTTRSRGGREMEFLTLEDETGLFEVSLFPDVYRRVRRAITDAGPYTVAGVVEEQYDVVTVNGQGVGRVGMMNAE